MVTRPRNLAQADPYFDSVVFLAPLSADDPYAGNVTLNVPFDGADAATLADDFSYKEHTLTFNANAQLDTAQSKFGTASCLFDGVGDYVSIPDDTSLSPEGVSFTVECHVRFNGDPGTDQHTFLGKWQGTGNQKEWWVGYRNNELNAFLSSNGSNGIFMADVAWDPAGDTWYHIAFVFDREAATDETRVYVDGTQIGSSDTTLNTYANFFNSTAPLWIGGYDDDTNDWMDGWIDNVRITKGVALYSGSSFTPPDAPFTTATVDDLSNSAHLIDFSGNAQLDKEIRKFGFTSLLVDDNVTADNGVSTPTSAAWANLKIADGFTVEAHVRMIDVDSNTNTLCSMWSWTRGSTTRSWGVFPNSSGGITIYVQNSTSSLTQNFSTAGSLISAGVWHHVVFQCQPAGNFEVFVDGTRVANVAPTISELRDPTDAFCIGATDDNADVLDGYVENVRITKGVARYTDGFTPPERAYPTVQNVSGLILDSLQIHLDAGNTSSYPGTGNTWTDLSGNGNDATYQATTAPFDSDGGGSFDFELSAAANDYFDITDDESLEPGETWSLCFWVKTGDVTGQQYISNKHSNDLAIICGYQTNAINLYWDGYRPSAAATQMSNANDEWTHYAYTKDSNGLSDNVKGYKNGVELVSETVSYTIPNGASSYRLGATGTGAAYYKGKISVWMQYSRPLSAAEVLTNFNAQKSRFGL